MAGSFALGRAQLTEARERQQAAADRRRLLQTALIVLRQAGAQGRERLIREVEWMLSEALQAIFGPRLKVQVELSERNRRPWAAIKVETPLSEGGTLAADPLDAHGGGVVDALSLALRIRLVESARPPLAGPLLLDEPGKHLSHEYLPRLVSPQPAAQG